MGKIVSTENSCIHDYKDLYLSSTLLAKFLIEKENYFDVSNTHHLLKYISNNTIIEETSDEFSVNNILKLFANEPIQNEIKDITKNIIEIIQSASSLKMMERNLRQTFNFRAKDESFRIQYILKFRYIERGDKKLLMICYAAEIRKLNIDANKLMTYEELINFNI